MNILGLGHFVPEDVLTNKQLEQMVDTSDEWITTRTGIKTRRIVKKGVACSDLAYNAAKKALEKARLEPIDLSHIIVGTFTADYCAPASACILQSKLGSKNCEMAIDISAGCSGFTYGLEVARGIVANKPEAKVLVVGSEVCTSRMNFKDRNTCVLFGDGAGAAVVTGHGDGASQVIAQVVDIELKTIGELGHLLMVGLEGGSAEPLELGQRVSEKYFAYMKGREVFKHAVRNMTEMSEYILKKNNLTSEDVDLFIPHQANYRIIEAIAKKMKIPMEKVFVNVDKYGNTSAASIILALSEAYSFGRIQRGDLVLLATFGAGFTVSSVILKFF